MRAARPCLAFLGVLSFGCGGATAPALSESVPPETVASEPVGTEAAPAPVADTPAGPVAMPEPRAGSELVGRSLADLAFDGWVGETHALAGSDAARATLVRWWTDTCPWCEQSLPALEELRRRHEPAGLTTVAVYHPKPPRPTEDEAVAAAARARGYRGPVALDPHWRALERAWPADLGRTATSVSLLLDAQGRIRFVHPGPVFFPSEDPAEARENADFRDLDRAVRALLGEASGE